MRNFLIKFIVHFFVLGATAEAEQIDFYYGKKYFKMSDLDVNGSSFHIHIGANQWILSNLIHCDLSGLYVRENELIRYEDSPEYFFKWKCEDCTFFWPLDVACLLPDCPSNRSKCEH